MHWLCALWFQVQMTGSCGLMPNVLFFNDMTSSIYLEVDRRQGNQKENVKQLLTTGFEHGTPRLRIWASVYISIARDFTDILFVCFQSEHWHLGIQINGRSLCYYDTPVSGLLFSFRPFILQSVCRYMYNVAQHCQSRAYISWTPGHTFFSWVCALSFIVPGLVLPMYFIFRRCDLIISVINYFLNVPSSFTIFISKKRLEWNALMGSVGANVV